MTDVIANTDSADLIPPTYDVAFKCIFGDPKHTAVLINFLNSIVVCKTPITKVNLENVELLAETKRNKRPKLDILATTQAGEIINIEMQVSNEGNIVPRALFYWSKLFARQLSTGEKYNDLKRTITISILDFNFFNQDKQYWHQYLLMDHKDHTVATELLEIHFLELKQMQALKPNSTILETWIEFLRNPYSEEMRKIAKINPEIAEAQDILARVNSDPQAREWWRMQEKTIRDEASALDYAQRTGRSQGLAEGRVEGKAEGKAEGIAIGEVKGKTEALSAVATNLARQGMTTSQIAHLTGLSISDIEKLKIIN